MVVLKLFLVDSANIQPFNVVVSRWRALRHPNIQKLFGAIYEGYNIFVCEYMPNGSLEESIEKSWMDRQTRNVMAVMKHLYEAALGLQYLHERGLAHGDFNLRNVLISSDGVGN